jgi:hypothetical protein
MSNRMQQRRATAARWLELTSPDNVLLAGEIGVETDTAKFKIGDGTTVWSLLPYATGGVDPDIPNVNSIDFDTTPTSVPVGAGVVSWDPNNVTVQAQLNDNVTLQIGQEYLIRVKNNSASVAIPDRTVVMFAGATGDTVKVTPAIASNIATYPSDYMVGITTEQIAADGFGFVTQFGFINHVDTSGWTVGTLLYADPATPGGLTSTQPAAPAWQTPIAAVTKQNANAGRILVRAIPGVSIGNVEGVEITSPADNNLLAYDTSSGTWINQTASQAGVAASTHSHAISDVTNLQTSLNAKAPLDSPALTGTPTAPTASAGTNTTQVATTAFVSTAVSNLVASAPTALDTLNELATALGNDPNFATTVTNSLAGKQPLDADLTAIAALSGTSGFLKKTAADTWSLDTTSYTPKMTLVGYGSGTSITISDSSSSYVDNMVNITSTSGAITITVNDSTFAVGTQITFLRNTTQTVTFASGTATVYATPGLKLRAQYSVATLMKVTDGSGSGDVWVLTGDLSA